MIGVLDGAVLDEHADLDPLFRSWLRGDRQLGSAHAELAQYFDLQAPPPIPGMAWRRPAFHEPWLQDLLPDLPDAAARERARDNVHRLVAGEADIVVTGQQPGFLGGPLYTLYKIAATIVLAEMRTAAGRRTVPLFWSGDDDDDLREALAPLAYDPQRRVLIGHEARASRSLGFDRMVGAVPAAEMAGGAAAWLREMAPKSDLAAALAGIVEDGIVRGASWAAVSRRAVLRLFRGSDLLVVSGDDPRLHTAAAEFYGLLWSQRGAYREAVRAAGARIAGEGFSVPLSDASIERFLHLGHDGARRPLAGEHEGDLPEAGSLRPGVLARSPVQDWLFRPVGVVVGPAEVAYLKQLTPGYEALGLPRAPLLPRLFGQLGPAGVGEFTAWARNVAGATAAAPAEDLLAAAARVAATGRNALTTALQEITELDLAEAGRLSSQLEQRWTRQVQRLLQRERERRQDGRGRGQPVWVRPDGQRQERVLACFGAAALWGDDLIGAVLHACRRHFDAGLDDRWLEHLLTVPEP
jgi:hypothetical protein